MLKDFADLAFFAFFEDEMESGEVFLRECLNLEDLGGGGFENGKLEAFFNLVDFGSLEEAVDFNEIFFFFFKFWMGEAISKVAIIGEEKKSFGVFVETTDGVNWIFFGD